MTQLASHVGRPGTFTAQGKTFQHGRWDRRVWVKLTDRASERLPNPVATITAQLSAMEMEDAKTIAELKKIDSAERVAAKAAGRPVFTLSDKWSPGTPRYFDAALKRSSMYLSSFSEEMQSFVNSVEGSCLVFSLLLQSCPGQEGMTEDDAWDIAEEIGQEKLQEIFSRASGKVPPKKNETTDLTDEAASLPPASSPSTGPTSTAGLSVLAPPKTPAS